MKSIHALTTLMILLYTSQAFSQGPLDYNIVNAQTLKKAMSAESDTIENQINKKFSFILKIEHSSMLTENWAKKICRETSESLLAIYGSSTQTHCFLKDNDHQDTEALIESKKPVIKADFELDLTRNLNNTVSVKLTNLKQADTNFANKVGMIIKYSSAFQTDLREYLLGSAYSINNLSLIRDTLVDLIYKDSKVNYDPKRDGTREEFYKKLTKSKYWTPKTRRFLTVGSELLATLSVGWFGYNYLSDNTADWDYVKEGEINSLENKIQLGSMFRYDDNSWGVNRNHVYAGVVYYLECRSSGFTALESYLCSIAGSTAWENLIEWREVFSINDTIFTSTGGAVLAESMHQMGVYIDQRAPSWFKNSIGWAYKGPKKAIQGYNSAVLGGDNSDLDHDDPIIGGKFEFEIGIAKVTDGKSEKRIALNNEVDLIPFFVEPGHEVKFIKNVVETQFSMDAPVTAIAQEYDIFAKVVMAAYYNKKIQIDSNNQLKGYSFYVGPSAALDIKNNQNFNNDFMGIVHFAGTSAKIVNFYKGFKITSSLDFWGDSVMMKSFMIEKYEGVNGKEGLVKNLAQSDYYHGWGTTSKGQVIVEYGRWTAGISETYSSAENTNSRQRDLGIVLKQLNINDQSLDTELFVECKINSSLKIKFAIDRIDRAGSIQDFGSGKSSAMRERVSLVYYF
ncbi:MAG: DUF3943 domain-containing protein [Rhizobacter sp.]|nr:DUF3943 domain-containing protein [Bacteriovorax sp.]